jgi:egghead protein (zeste-white 4 protein)
MTQPQATARNLPPDDAEDLVDLVDLADAGIGLGDPAVEHTTLAVIADPDARPAAPGGKPGGASPAGEPAPEDGPGISIGLLRAFDPAAVAESERVWAPSRVRAVYLVALAVVGVPLYLGTSDLWRHSRPGHGIADAVVSGSSYVWLLLAVPVLLNVLGILGFRRGSTNAYEHAPITSSVSFRIVTRGTNVEAVLKTIEAVRVQMARFPLFPHLIEVVTDNDLPIAPAQDLVQIRVPDDYATPGGARFKARALHFALQASAVSETTWLFHLDEETHITPSVIRGIRTAIIEEEATGQCRIGQGVVLYHRDLREHPVLTLADSVRTGDDLGRFRFQHLVGQTMFGMLGPAGSITEDAWWSLVEMGSGRRSRWVDGYCLEQSTRSFTDFIRQRRRWFVGLTLVSFRAPALRWHRLSLVTSIVLWGVSWLGWWAVSVAMFVTGARIPLGVFVVGVFSLAAYVAVYLVGLELNLSHRGLRWYRRLPWYVAQIVLMPLFSFMESAAVIYGLVRPERGFHVVKK